VTALAYMSLDLLLLGFLNAAQQVAEQSVEEARRLAHPTSLCFAHSVVCRVHYLLRDMDALAQRSAMVERLADEHGLNLWRALGSIYTGWSRAENGAVREGAAMIRDGIARYRAGGSALSLPLYLASLASLEGTLGNQPEALKLLAEAQAASTAGNEHWMSAEIHRLTGETMLARNRDMVGAEREFRVAIALAREHGAKLWELRAATSLARLLRDCSKARAAFDRLATVYRSFGEGFTQPDLEQAKAVLGWARSPSAACGHDAKSDFSRRIASARCQWSNNE
jgi:predicted ATPase